MALDMLSELINKFEINDDSVICICNSKMKTFNDVSIVYSGHGHDIGCDKCGIECKDGDTFWHCPMEYNVIHPDGYDICNKCMFVTEVTTVTEEENSPSPDHSSVFVMCNGVMTVLYYKIYYQV